MKITQIRESLKKIMAGQVLWDDEILRYYSVDASSFQIFPDIVVVPKNEKDVIQTIKFAKKIKMPVTPRGAGTGLVGSALNKGIILDLRNLNSIKIRGNSVNVGVGVFKGMLDQRLADRKKLFAPNPSVGAYCSIGGMLGNNSSGSKSLKYGSVIDNTTEVTFVNGNGDRITLPKNKKIGRKILDYSKKITRKRFPTVSKNSSGYRLDAVKTIKDTHKVIIGSEGTLGIILSAKLKIRDIPDRRVLCVIAYQTQEEAARSCIDILKTSPAAIEFMDKTTLDHIPQKFDKEVQCLLFVEYDNDIKTKIKRLKEIVTGTIVKQIARESEIQQWWKYRDSSLYYSLKSIKTENRIPHIIEDAAVPLENLGKLFLTIEKLNRKFQIRSIMYGHAGDGNIHVRLDSCGKKIKINDIVKYYFKEVNKIGGTITGEHGDGIVRTEFVRVQYGQKNYQAFKRLKKHFDPYGILNPGKIISKKLTYQSMGDSKN